MKIPFVFLCHLCHQANTITGQGLMSRVVSAPETPPPSPQALLLRGQAPLPLGQHAYPMSTPTLS